MPGNEFVATDGGNKREGGPSRSEIRQSIIDIKSWFERCDGFDTPNGASSVDFQRMTKALEIDVSRNRK
jgi:hypothetical protein